MKKIDNWYVDEDNNKWISSLYTQNVAEKLSKSLTHCKDCINCVSCIDCISCVGCSNCSSCLNCKSCSYCNACNECKGCVACYNISYKKYTRNMKII